MAKLILEKILYYINYIETFPHLIRVTLILQILLEILHQKLHFSPRKWLDHVTSLKICNYQSHPFLMWKSFNVVG